MKFPCYDNKDYKFRHDDSTAVEGRSHAARLLGLESIAPQQLIQFDLSFYSGGIGVLDKHAIAIDADEVVWKTAMVKIDAQTVVQCAAEIDWAEDFVWLIAGDEEFESIETAAVSFINSERKPFQDECDEEMRIFFGQYSNVNDWSVIWGTESRLNALFFSQG